MVVTAAAAAASTSATSALRIQERILSALSELQHFGVVTLAITTCCCFGLAHRGPLGSLVYSLIYSLIGAHVH